MDYGEYDETTEYAFDHEVFDDDARSMLEDNHMRLKADYLQAQERTEKTPPIVFRMDVRAPQDPSTRGRRGAITEIDLRTAIENTWRATQGADSELPSENCYIDSIRVHSARNDFPKDMMLYEPYNNIQGTFERGRVVGANNPAPLLARPCLHVMHSGGCFHGPPVEVYRAQNFMRGETFRTYAGMLRINLADGSAKVSGQVEYLSPVAHDPKLGPDCECPCLCVDATVVGFLEVVYRNSNAFNSSVTSIRCKDPQTGEDKLSLRFSDEDWNGLKTAVTQSIIDPLRAHILDLSTSPRLDFTIVPDCEGEISEDDVEGLSTSDLSGATAWRNKELQDAPKDARAIFVLEITVHLVV